MKAVPASNPRKPSLANKIAEYQQNITHAPTAAPSPYWGTDTVVAVIPKNAADISSPKQLL